ncbi:MAG: glycerol-3-phosphate acyltransferase [Chloroflexi bacterium]|nr:glycerol-3-phosphate acyltransferase [Chloroflexota bacterium]
MADIVIVLVLITAAFILGSCPFSLWIGSLRLHKDIRNYGDGNPGAANVFKAGGKWWGVAAVIADIVKGVPFVLLAKWILYLSQPVVYLVAAAAVLGHAYSPFLHFKGGKALAVFAGTLIALSQWDVISYLVIFLLLGFFFIGNDSWIVIFGMTGTLVALLASRADTWEMAFIFGIAVLSVIKQFNGLQVETNKPGRLICWIRSNRKTV